MPSRPLRPCRHPGCPALTQDGYCPAHKPKDNRESSSARGYTKAWQKFRATYLANHPWCVECLSRGIYTPATDVDHILPHRGDLHLFWEVNNLQALCHSCHSRKTAKEDGGFGM